VGVKVVTSNARRQLTEVATGVRRGVAASVAVLVASSLLYLPILGQFDVLAVIETYVSLEQFLRYVACSFTGGLLFVAADLLGDDTDSESEAHAGAETDGDRKEDVEVTTREGVRVLFVQIARVNAITVLLFSGALAGVVTASSVGPTFAPLVAVLYPILDMRLYRRIGYPTTPVTLLMIVSYLPAAVVTGAIVLWLITLGVVLGPPLAVVRAVGQLHASTDPLVTVRNVIRIPTPRRR
jgi:hypothetical protein